MDALVDALRMYRSAAFGAPSYRASAPASRTPSSVSAPALAFADTAGPRDSIAGSSGTRSDAPVAVTRGSAPSSRGRARGGAIAASAWMLALGGMAVSVRTVPGLAHLRPLVEQWLAPPQLTTGEEEDDVRALAAGRDRPFVVEPLGEITGDGSESVQALAEPGEPMSDEDTADGVEAHASAAAHVAPPKVPPKKPRPVVHDQRADDLKDPNLSPRGASYRMFLEPLVRPVDEATTQIAAPRIELPATAKADEAGAAAAANPSSDTDDSTDGTSPPSAAPSAEPHEDKNAHAAPAQGADKSSDKAEEEPMPDGGTEPLR
jgi:hypothetical protein